MADDAKTLEELIKILEAILPDMDDVVQTINDDHPEVTELIAVEGTNQLTPSYMLGRIVGIGVMDFLCAAFGRTDLGYTSADERDG